MARLTGEEALTIAEVADRLGVHYRTVYRAVRAGRLPAVKDGRDWHVSGGDLDAFMQAGRRRPVQAKRPPAPLVVDLSSQLLQADERGSWGVVRRAVGAGMTPAQVLVDVVGPALGQVGDLWESGEITVGQEHQASAVATRLIGRLGPRHARRRPWRAHVIIGAPPQDSHALPSAIVHDLLRGHGVSVTDLGANVPAESWASCVRAASSSSRRLAAAGICVSMDGREAQVRAAIRAIRAEAPIPIVLGGHGVGSAADAAGLGATRYSDSATEAVEHLVRYAT